jgi:Holliday junction resolvase YEN1
MGLPTCATPSYPQTFHLLTSYRLFDEIKDHDKSVPIAQLAEEHHQRHGRPLRIAVDEADWRFNNLTQVQIYTIRDSKRPYGTICTSLTPLASDPRYQGQEKNMFQRICRLLTLNIQLIFVFDGPGRPWKRGKRGKKFHIPTACGRIADLLPTHSRGWQD